MRDGARPAAGDRRGRPALRPAPALLGGRRQRAEHGRRRRGADQAVASSATSRSPATSPRTRSTSTCRPSRSSSCAPPASSGRTADDVAKEVAIYRAHKAAPIVIATEGEERFRAAARGDRRAGGRARARLRAVGRWSATCSATRPRWPSTRSARPAARGPRGDRAAVGSGAPRRRRARRGCASAHRPARPALRRRPAQRRATTATSRRARRCASARLLRDVIGPSAARGVPARVRQGRHAGRCWSTTSPRRSRGRSRSSPGRSTPSSTRPRRSPSASRRSDESVLDRAARAGGAGRRRRARPAQLPHAAGRSPTSTRRSTRSSASPATASTATRRGDATIEIVDRGGLARERARRGSSATRSCAARSAASPCEREVLVARGRGDGRTVVLVPEVKGGARAPASRCCTCGSHDRLPAADDPRACCRATDRRYDRLVDWVTETEPALPRRPARRRSPVVDLLLTDAESPTLAPSRWRVVIGVGVDAVDVERFRRVAGAHAVACASGSSPTASWATPPRGRPGAALGGPLRGQGGGDEGARRRARRVRVPRRRGGAGRIGPAAACTSQGRALELAAGRGVARWHLSLTHTELQRPGRRHRRVRSGAAAPQLPRPRDRSASPRCSAA